MSVPLPDGRLPGQTGPRTIRARKLVIAILLPLLLAVIGAVTQSALTAGHSSMAPPNHQQAGRVEPSSTPNQPGLVNPQTKLAVESRPEGATVVIDGAERGRTPLLLEKLDVGSHQIKLSMEGLQEWQGEVTLLPGETRRLEIVLQARTEPSCTPTAEPKQPIYPVAVMVENHSDARPQSGLARADIVYEALVEGGITRFMAIYVKGESDAIGPVRSARHYFVYLAAEHNASLVHIGSSPQGYAALDATGITNLDETYGDPGFWRVRTREAPHNAYTSTSLIRSSLERVREVTPGSLAGFRFGESSKPVTGTPAADVSLVYPGGYRVEYVYCSAEKLYRRYMEGLPHKDAETGEQVSPRNLIVQYVNAWVIDDVGRLDMEQVGQGKAVYFREGVATEGYWQKPSYGNFTQWYDSAWNPILMSPGKIWIQIVPPSAKLSY